MKLILKNLLPILTIVLGITIAVLTIKGEIQKIIQFQDEMNEMGFAMAGIFLVMIGLMGVELENK